MHGLTKTRIVEDVGICCLLFGGSVKQLGDIIDTRSLSSIQPKRPSKEIYSPSTVILNAKERAQCLH